MPLCSSPVLTSRLFFLFFFFNDTATTEIYTLSLHDALPIFWAFACAGSTGTSEPSDRFQSRSSASACGEKARSEEHTSELQSRSDLVCRLLLEKKNSRIDTRNLRRLCSEPDRTRIPVCSTIH